MDRIQRLLMLLFCMTFALANFGCTSKSSESKLVLGTPPMKIQKPGFSAMAATGATLELQYLAVNISASDINPPIFRAWDLHDGAILPAIELLVPAGKGRLVQTLAIYGKAGSDGASEIYYGDAVKDLISGSNDVLVILDPVSKGSDPVTGSGGRIAGRYIRADGSGYTGVINYKFQPPNGRPSMVVHRGEMFNGWFSIFALQGSAYFTYELGDKSLLFDGPIGADSASLLATGITATRTARFLYRAHYRDRYENGQLGTRESVESERVTVGFFGPGATATQKVCYNNTPHSIDERWTALAAGAAYYWVGNNPVDAFEAGLETVGGVAGGSQNDSTDCLNTSLRYTQTIPWDENDSHDGIGFQGPFVAVSGNYGKTFVGTSYNSISEKLNLNWALLPGVGGSEVSEIHVYRRLAGSGEGYKVDDGYRCNALDAYGFTKVASVPHTTTSAQIDVGSLAWNAGGVKVILCPYSSSRGAYFQSGVESFESGSNENVQLEFVSPATTVASGTCQPYTVELKRNGVSQTLPPGKNLTFQLGTQDGLNGVFYATSASCGSQTGAITQSSILSGNSTQTFYLRPTNGGFGKVRAYVSNILGSNQVAEAIYPVASSTGVAPSKVMIEMANKMAVGHCYPVYIALVSNSGPQGYPTGGGSIGLTPSVGGTFSELSDCTSGTAVAAGTTHPVSFPAGIAARLRFFMPSGQTTVGTMATSNTHTWEDQDKAIAVGPNTVSQYHLVNSQNPSLKVYDDINVCTEVKIVSTNSVGAPIPVLANQTVVAEVASSTPGPGTIHSQPNCSDTVTQVSRTIYRDQSEASERLYYRKTTEYSGILFHVGPVGTPTGSMFFLKQPTNVQFTGTPLMTGGTCYSLNVALRDGLQAYTVKTPLTLNYSFTGGPVSGGGFYADSGCSAALSGGSQLLAVGQQSTTVYVMISSASGPFMLNASPQGTGLTFAFPASYNP